MEVQGLSLWVGLAGGCQRLEPALGRVLGTSSVPEMAPSMRAPGEGQPEKLGEAAGILQPTLPWDCLGKTPLQPPKAGSPHLCCSQVEPLRPVLSLSLSPQGPAWPSMA